MSLKAGRVGVNPADVDPIDGHISPSSVDAYTKQEADAKFSTKDELRIAINDIDLLMGSKLNNVYGVMGENGAKNGLPLSLSALKSDTDNSGTWTGNVYNKSNVDFTVNDDKSITINTGTGGASADTQLLLNFDYPAGNYILNGCSGGSIDTYWIDVYNAKWTGRQYNYDGDTQISFTGTTKRVFRVFVKSGVTVSNVTVYPMIRDARDTNSTYQPPCMTNKELTDAVSVVNESALTDIITGATATVNKLYKIGKIVFASIYLSSVTADDDTTLGIVPEDYRPLSGIRIVSATSDKNIVSISPTGYVKAIGSISNKDITIYSTWIIN